MKQQNEAEKNKKELQFHIKTLKAQLSEYRVNKKEIEANALKKANQISKIIEILYMKYFKKLKITY